MGPQGPEGQGCPKSAAAGGQQRREGQTDQPRGPRAQSVATGTGNTHDTEVLHRVTHCC